MFGRERTRPVLRVRYDPEAKGMDRHVFRAEVLRPGEVKVIRSVDVDEVLRMVDQHRATHVYMDRLPEARMFAAVGDAASVPVTGV